MRWRRRRDQGDAEDRGSQPSAATARSAQPDGFRLPEGLALSAEAESGLRDALWREVLLGCTDPDDMLESLEEELSGWGIDDATAEAAAQAVVRARSAQQARWADEVTVSNLLAAFEDLAGIGVVARDHFSCCGTCASSEIWDERDDSRTWRGYVYFHQQDTESLIEERSTYIGYGAFLDAWLPEAEWVALPDDQKDARYADIVRGLMEGEVFPLLRRHGIAVTWDGDLGRRILLENADYYVPV